MLRIESGVNSLEAQEAADEQACPNQQHRRHRYVGHYKQAAPTAAIETFG